MRAAARFLTRLLVAVVDHAPAWIWRPVNLRFIGSTTIHFCYDGHGHRTIEIGDRTIVVGSAVLGPHDEVARHEE